MAARPLRLAILLSVLAAVVTLGLKLAAWLVTGSVGLLSDAAESVVNLIAALFAYVSLVYSARPADRTHAYGHEKIEYFSSGLEGGLICVAAVGIGWTAVDRLRSGTPPQELGTGLAIALVASGINFGVALLLLRLGRRHRSIILEADGRHLLADVWTSVAVVAGLVVVWLTGYHPLDPVIALVMAGYILWTAGGLVVRSFHGLMDRALPEPELAQLRDAIKRELGPDMAYHALRTRQAGATRFAEFHLLVPGSLTVREAHDIAHRVEDAIRAALPGVEVTTHVEPIEDPASWRDGRRAGGEIPYTAPDGSAMLNPRGESL